MKLPYMQYSRTLLETCTICNHHTYIDKEIGIWVGYELVESSYICNNCAPYLEQSQCVGYMLKSEYVQQ